MTDVTRKSHIKVALAIILLSVVASLIASFITYHSALRTEREDAFRRLEQLARTVENTALSAAYIEDEELAQEIVEGLVLNDIVSGARLRATSGFEVTSTDYRQQNDSVTLPLRNFFYDESVGALIVYADSELIQRTAEDVAKRLAVSLINYSVMLALFVSWLVFYMLSNPLRRLNESFLRIDPSDPQPLAMLKGHEHDEIGTVLKGINKLMAAIDFHMDRERSLRFETEKLERRFRLIFERASAGIAVVTHTNSIITRNPAFSALLGIEETGVQDFPSLFLNADDLSGNLDRLRNIPQLNNITLDLKRSLPSGEIRWLHGLISRISDQRQETRKGGGPLVEVILYDVTDRIEQEEQTRFEADHDALTHLNNRRSGERLLSDLIKRAVSERMSLVFMAIDLDKFKPVNDQHGHDAGDLVLVEASKRMRQLCQQADDLCIRWGGDEFAIARMMPKRDDTLISALGQDIIDSLSRPFTLPNGVECSIGASVGIVVGPDHGSDLETLMGNADTMMYYVKTHGRNNYGIFDPETEYS